MSGINKTVAGENAAALPLVGTELVRIVQSGNSSRCTVQDIANLAVVSPQGGNTSARPATPILYQSYFDTTLQFPIFCTQVSPPIWVSSSGVAV